MRRRTSRRSLRPALLAVGLAVLLGLDVPALSANESAEAARLAALLRQLDVIERLAQQSAEAAATNGSRYHFDYARFHADVERVRGGIQHYLNPLRAQPRDPDALHGDYRREADEDTSP